MTDGTGRACREAGERRLRRSTPQPNPPPRRPVQRKGTLERSSPPTMGVGCRRGRQGGRDDVVGVPLRRHGDRRRWRDGRGRLQGRRGRDLRASANRPDQAPIVGLWHSGGALARRGRAALHAVGEILPRHDPGLGKVRSIGGARPGGGVRRTAWCDRDGRPRGRGGIFACRRRGPPVPAKDVDTPSPGGRVARPLVRCRAHPHRQPSRRAIDCVRARSRRGRCAGARTSTRSRTLDLAQLCRSRRSGRTTRIPLVEAILDEGTYEEVHAKWAHVHRSPRWAASSAVAASA